MTSNQAREQTPEQRVRAANLIAGAMSTSTVVVFGFAVYFYFTADELIAYVLLAFALLMIPMIFWLRKRLIRGDVQRPPNS